MNDLKRIWFGLCFSLIGLSSFAKSTIDLDVKEVALKKVFNQLHRAYGIQFSYDDKLVSEYKLTLKKQFSTTEEAIAHITNLLGLNYESVNGVFVIYKKIERGIHSVYSGQLIDPVTNEPLPYTSIQTSFGFLVTDENGQFFFETNNPKENFKASHIGYFVLDTIIQPKTNQKLYLQPSSFEVDEVLVKSKTGVFDIHIGENAGSIKLNQKLAKLLPGNNSNTIYNLLRLQPGILANSEFSGGYNIWGSDRGDNQILFDGITIFNTSSLDTEIGIINPLLVKNIELYRTGFETQFGDVSGGVIEILGKQGNPKENRFEVNANNTLFNGITNLSLGKQTSLQLAFRHSYKDWLTSILGEKKDDSYDHQYDFKDVNLKLTSLLNEYGKLSIGFLKNWDNQNTLFYFNKEEKNDRLEYRVDKNQLGLTSSYELNHDKWGWFKLSYAYSELEQEQQETSNENPTPEIQEIITNPTVKNGISESKVKLSHQVNGWDVYALKYGVEYKQNKTHINDSFDETPNHQLNIYTAFIQNSYSPIKDWTLSFGMRTNYVDDMDDYYHQPRVSSKYALTDNLKLNMSWGKYMQFNSEASYINEAGNRSYFWTLAQKDDSPAIEATHSSIGLMYKWENLMFNIDGYYKEVDGKLQYEQDSSEQYALNVSNRNLYGMNLFVKYKFDRHKLWLNYALSKSEERSETVSTYSFLPHHQTHEIKGALLLNFYPFFISSNYVYGSGLDYTRKFTGSLKSYSRFDLAFLYKYNLEYVSSEFGVSMVNVFANKNISIAGLRYNQLDEATLNSGTPFTPSIFLNLKF